MNEAPPRRTRRPATRALVQAIFIGLALQILTGAWGDPEVLRRIGATLPMEVLRETGDYWRLLVSMFLHGGGTIFGTLLHLAVNLVALWQLGSVYELMFGTRRFLIIYFFSGIVASLTSAMNLPPDGSSVGASGAIAGILGATISSVYRSPRFRHDRGARSVVAQCMFWVVANIAIGMNLEGLDHAAHAGGLLAGLFLGALLPHHPPPPPAPRDAVVDVAPQ